jgi:hypothetical protein
MGNQDSAGTPEARTGLAGEGNSFLASNVERLAGWAEQTACKAVETDPVTSPEAFLLIKRSLQVSLLTYSIIS